MSVQNILFFLYLLSTYYQPIVYLIYVNYHVKQCHHLFPTYLIKAIVPNLTLFLFIFFINKSKHNLSILKRLKLIQWAEMEVYKIGELDKQIIIIMIDNSSLAHPYQKLCRIKSKKSDKYLSISTDPQTKGVAILAQKRDKLQNRFIITKYSLVHSFQSLLNNQYLSIAYGSKQPGAMLVTLPDYGDASQRFLLKSVGVQNQYVIESHCGLVLDCYEEGTEEGTVIIQWWSSGEPHQIWKLQFL